jgi:hypothetical protein
MMPRAWSFLFGTVLRLNEELGYGGPLVSRSPLPLLFSRSSYFWPLGIVAPSRDQAEVICSSVNPMAPLR